MSDAPDVVEAALTMCAGAGAFADVVKKFFFHGHPFDVAGAQAALSEVEDALALASEMVEKEARFQD